MTNAYTIPDHCALHETSGEMIDTDSSPSMWPQQQPQANPSPSERIVQVRITTHTGAVFFWLNQRRTVRGTYAQCAAALSNAQTHNLILGWWSLLSILFMNWIAIAENAGARRSLDREVQAYTQWWQQNCASRCT